MKKAKPFTYKPITPIIPQSSKNLKYDNGLDIKPIVNPAHQSMYLKEENKFQQFIYLSDKDIEKLGNFYVEDFFVDVKKKRGEIWLFINDIYLVLSDLNIKIIEELQKKKLDFCFFKEDKTFITAFRLA
jgi:hypothetical protein